MRTLVLLTALLLLAFQAQAQTLQETADQVPAQDQPGEEDQDLLGDEDQDVADSLTGEERLTRQFMSPGIRKKLTRFIKKKLPKILSKISPLTKIKIPVESCLCQPQDECPYTKVNKALERVSRPCKIFGRRYKFCCK